MTTKEYNWFRVVAYCIGCGMVGYVFARVYEIEPILTFLGLLGYLLVLMDTTDKKEDS